MKLFPKLCFLQILDPTMRNDANRMKDKLELKTGNIDGTNLRIKLVYWCQGLIKKPAQLGPQYSAHIEIEGKRAASNWLNVCDAPFDVWHYMVEHNNDKQIYTYLLTTLQIQDLCSIKISNENKNTSIFVDLWNEKK